MYSKVSFAGMDEHKKLALCKMLARKEYKCDRMVVKCIALVKPSND